MSYEITMRKANCLYEGVEDPVFVTITSSSSDVALLSRSDALELAAAHDMREALEAIKNANYRKWDEGLNNPKEFVSWAQSIASHALKKAEGKAQA